MRARHRRQPHPLPPDDRRAAAARAPRRKAAPRERHRRSDPRTRSWSPTAASTRCTSSARRCSSRATKCDAGSGMAAVRRQRPRRAGPCRSPCPLHEHARLALRPRRARVEDHAAAPVPSTSTRRTTRPAASSRRADSKGIAAIAREHDLWLISDEAYEDVVFDGEHVSPASLPGMYERTIPIYTFSKSYAMTGLRLGLSRGARTRSSASG